jgi:hypothetical protein
VRMAATLAIAPCACGGGCIRPLSRQSIDANATRSGTMEQATKEEPRGDWRRRKGDVRRRRGGRPQRHVHTVTRSMSRRPSGPFFFCGPPLPPRWPGSRPLLDRRWASMA